MQIAVTTPTGNVGRHVVQLLVRAGVRPRLVMRHPDRLPADLRTLVDVATADQFVPDQVAAATEGVDALFWVDPSTGSQDPLADYEAATASVVRAVRENGIGRVVFQSSVGAEKRQGAGEIDGLAATEVALDDLVGGGEVSVTHLRCGFFFTNLELQLDALRAGTVPVVLPLDQPLSWVAPRDIAEVAVGRLVNPDWSGRVVQGVHGPVDLTWPQAAKIVSAATGTEVTVERIADDEMAEALRGSGMSERLVQAVLGMSTGLRDGFVPEQPRDVLTTTPTTLGAWSYDVLRPLLRSPSAA